MIDKRVVIAALARDCNEALVRNIPRIEQLRTCFSHSQVVVVENDSRDGTKGTLREWASNSKNIHLIINDFNTLTIESVSIDNPNPMTSVCRIEKMARYRNMYMDYVRLLSEVPDYMIVIDVDVESFSVDGIIKAIVNAPDNWGALFAFGTERIDILGITVKRTMYDMFAYVHRELPSPFTVDYMFSQKRKIANRVKKEGCSECLSAFGSIGIYKWEIIKKTDYVAEYNDDKLINVLCEHIPFNSSIAQHYKNYICREMRSDYGKCSAKLAARMLMPEFLFRLIQRIRK